MTQTQPTDTLSGDSFAALFEQAAQGTGATEMGGEGQIVTGIVVAVNRDTVIVDIGGKSEGVIKADEFVDASGQLGIKPGDRVDVFIESRENDDGLISLSKEKADKMKVWDEISRACERDEIIEGTISQRVKGGLSRHHPRRRQGVPAGLAGRPPADPQPRQADRPDLRVQGHQVQQEARQHRALAPRAAREGARRDEGQDARDTSRRAWSSPAPSRTSPSTARSSISAASTACSTSPTCRWGRVNHPSEVFKVGDEVTVKVLKYNAETERVSPRPQADPGRPVEPRRRGLPARQARPRQGR